MKLPNWSACGLIAEGALPRYAISLPRLREYIDTLVRARLPVPCP